MYTSVQDLFKYERRAVVRYFYYQPLAFFLMENDEQKVEETAAPVEESTEEAAPATEEATEAPAEEAAA